MNNIILKCLKCNKEKPLNEFCIRNCKPTKQCLECKRDYNRKYELNHPRIEHKREIAKQWRLNHKLESKTYNQNYKNRIEATFQYHKPTENGLEKIEQVRIAFSKLLRTLNKICPDSTRLKFIAITNLETAAMFMTKNIVFTDGD